MRRTDVSPEALARIRLDEAARVAHLWSKPILADREVAEALGLPYSTWAARKKAGDAPVLFHIGRRLYARTTDVLEYLNGKYKRAAGGAS